MTTPAPVSIEETRRTIAQLRAEQQFEPKPDLDQLQHKVNHWTTQATINPALRGELQVAVLALEQARATIADNTQRQNRIVELTNQLADAEQDQRMARIELANRQLEDANNEYRNACLLAARAYRRLLRQQRNSQQVPGAKTVISAGLHVPFLMPQSWQGTLGDAMKQGLMPWEQQQPEREAA
jgi:hypothetical protein